MPARGGTDAFARLLGRRLCIDFVNTIEDPFGERQDFLHTYDDLVRWCSYSGALADAEADELRELAARRAGDTHGAFAEAIGLRSSLDRIFRSLAQGDRPPAADMHLLQQKYAEAIPIATLVRSGETLAWSWRGLADLRQPVWLVLQSAIEVLTEGDLRRVKQCPGANDCGWLFYDTSRNATRRWCSMEGCGSRVKMRRHYARKKERQARP